MCDIETKRDNMIAYALERGVTAVCGERGLTGSIKFKNKDGVDCELSCGLVGIPMGRPNYVKWRVWFTLPYNTKVAAFTEWEQAIDFMQKAVKIAEKHDVCG